MKRKKLKETKEQKKRKKELKVSVSTELRKQLNDLDVDGALLRTRKLFLFDDIDEESSKEIIKSIHVLDARRKGNIYLYINSYGGDPTYAISVIDAIERSRSNVITIITGEADSAAGLISICGNKRWMTKYSYWMAHDLSGGFNDEESLEKVTPRVKYLNEFRDMCTEIMKKRTKLTDVMIDKALRGELWLNAEKAKKLGVVDKII